MKGVDSKNISGRGKLYRVNKLSPKVKTLATSMGTREYKGHG